MAGRRQNSRKQSTKQNQDGMMDVMWGRQEVHTAHELQKRVDELEEHLTEVVDGECEQEVAAKVAEAAAHAYDEAVRKEGRITKSSTMGAVKDVEDYAKSAANPSETSSSCPDASEDDAAPAARRRAGGMRVAEQQQDAGGRHRATDGRKAPKARVSQPAAANGKAAERGPQRESPAAADGASDGRDPAGRKELCSRAVGTAGSQHLTWRKGVAKDRVTGEGLAPGLRAASPGRRGHGDSERQAAASAATEPIRSLARLAEQNEKREETQGGAKELARGKNNKNNNNSHKDADASEMEESAIAAAVSTLHLGNLGDALRYGEKLHKEEEVVAQEALNRLLDAGDEW